MRSLLFGMFGAFHVFVVILILQFEFGHQMVAIC
jgi:hypothetical protein